MSTVENLKAARAKLASGWVAWSRAVDDRGFYVTPSDPKAVKWCALGALDAVMVKFANGTNTDDADPEVRALDRHIPEPYRDYAWAASRVAQYSNRLGRECALALFDTTIASLENPYAGCLEGYPRG